MPDVELVVVLTAKLRRDNTRYQLTNDDRERGRNNYLWLRANSL